MPIHLIIISIEASISSKTIIGGDQWDKEEYWVGGRFRNLKAIGTQIIQFCKEGRQQPLHRRRCNVLTRSSRRRRNFSQPRNASLGHTFRRTSSWCVRTFCTRPWCYRLPTWPAVIRMNTSFMASASMSDSSGMSMIFSFGRDIQLFWII